MPQRTKIHETDGPAPSPTQPLASWYTQGVSDGLGDRLLMFDNSSAPSLELLRFRPELADFPGFEAALREQLHRFARFQHPAFARVRSVQRLEPDDDLALISNYTPGKRLSEVLHRARGPAFAAALVRQLAPALAQFQHHHPGVSHGLLSPDRIVVSPEARLTIVEHVVGPAIEMVGLGTLELAAIGVALPPAAAGTVQRIDAAADWYQLGLVALSVLMGRAVNASELPQLASLLDQLGDVTAPDGTPLSPFIRQWLDRTLQISGDRIESDADARVALDELIRKEQPRDSRVVPIRQAPPDPPAAEFIPAEPPADALPAEPVADPPRDVVAARPNVVTFTRPAVVDLEPEREPVAVSPVAVSSAAVDSFTRPSIEEDAPPAKAIPRAPVEPEPAAPPAPPTSIFGLRGGPEPPPRPPHVRVGSDHVLSPFEREALAERMRRRDLATAARVRDEAAASVLAADGARKTTSTAVVAALALLVALEAGVIAWFARALWSAPSPAMVVETTASGDNVVLSSHPLEPGPLRITVAPDLRWTQVVSPSAQGVLDGKAGDGAGGTLRISSPIALKVMAGARTLGSVPGADLKLAPGRHDLVLANDAVGYRLAHRVEVAGGETIAFHVAPPPGWVTIEAPAGVEISIDGQPVGRTPLATMPLALGEHQITFKHPTAGSDRQRVTVKADEPTRVVGKLR